MRVVVDLRSTTHYFGVMPKTPRTGPTLHHEPAAVTYARENAGLTMTEVAAKLGKSLQLISDIEAGRRNATPDTLNKLAVIFNCPRVVLERKRWVA